MGNMSEYRGLIVIITFVSITLLIIGMAVSETPDMFATSNTQGSSPLSGSNVPGPSGFFAWNETTTIQLNDTNFEQTLSIGGTEMMFGDRSDGGSIKFLQVETYQSFYGMFLYNREDFTWYNKTNQLQVSSKHDVYSKSPYTLRQSQEVMDMNDVDIAYANGNISALTYELKNTRTKITVSLGFNFTEYDTPSLALADEGLFFDINQQFDDRDTSINLIAFISGLFLFSIPGVDPTVCAIISFALDSALIYITFIFVLRIIGAVFGGGGS